MKKKDAYTSRPGFYKDVKRREWEDWKWQSRNTVADFRALLEVFPDFPRGQIFDAEKSGVKFRFTPYLLSLIGKDAKGKPLKADPVWKQVFPRLGESGAGRARIAENWEVDAEMITPITQHKYDNRVIVYVSDCCFGHCMYCFRALQKASKRPYGGLRFWGEAMEAIKRRPQVEEVILSGGDPLVYDNGLIGNMLKDLRGVKSVEAIRIHTRAWTYNPYRIDKVFCGLLKKYAVTEMGVHVIHPSEITADFLAAVGRVRASGARTLLMCDTPLIKGINDDEKILRELFMRLYTAGVKPYYLSHCMPGIPAEDAQRTGVKKGLRLMNGLKRRISNPAVPEYIITHRSGKKTVPECEEGTPDFVYGKNKNGQPVIRFRNWKGKWATYIDGKG